MSCLKWCVPSPPSWSWIRTRRPRSLLFRCTGTWWRDWSLTRWTVSFCSLLADTEEENALLYHDIFWAVTNADFYKYSHLSCIFSQLSLIFVLRQNLCSLYSPTGVQFIWDSCCESVKKANSTAGSGCVLAHCMGLGKTLQVKTYPPPMSLFNLQHF